MTADAQKGEIGISKRGGLGTRYSDEELLAEVRRVAEVVNKPTLTTTEFVSHGRVRLLTLRRRFGGWRSTLEWAGLGSLKWDPCKYSDEEMLAEVRRVAEVVNKPTLTVTEYKSHGRRSLSVLRRRFGGWGSILARAGCECLKPYRPRYSDEELLAEVRRVADVVNKPTLTVMEFVRHTCACLSTLRRRFGGWRSILEQAGLDNLYSGAVTTHRRSPKLSVDDLIRMMRETADEDGALTLTRFMTVTGAGRGPIYRHFGRWGNALALAGLTKPEYWKLHTKEGGCGKRHTNAGRCRKRHTDEDCYRNIFDLWIHCGRRPYYAELNRPPSRVAASIYARRWNGWRNAFAAFLEWANSDEAKRLEWEWDKLAGFGRKPDDE